MDWPRITQWYAGIRSVLAFPGGGVGEVLFAIALLGLPGVIVYHAARRMWGREERYGEVLGWALFTYVLIATRAFLQALPHDSDTYAVLRALRYGLIAAWVIYGVWRVFPAVRKCQCGRARPATGEGDGLS